MDFNKILLSKEYDFLRTNPLLKGNICLLTLGGSYAYGTNNENSDLDIRGVAYNRVSDILGLRLNPFEQYVNEKTDTTIYSINKIIRLLISCNPNTILL